MTPINQEVDQSRDGLLAALNYVIDNTYCGVDAEWHFKPGYDPQIALDALSRPSLEPTLGSHTDCIGAHPSDRAGRPTAQAPTGLGDTATSPCAKLDRLKWEMENNFDGHCYTITQDALDAVVEGLECRS